MINYDKNLFYNLYLSVSFCCVSLDPEASIIQEVTADSINHRAPWSIFSNNFLCLITDSVYLSESKVGVMFKFWKRRLM